MPKKKPKFKRPKKERVPSADSKLTEEELKKLDIELRNYLSRFGIR